MIETINRWVLSVCMLIAGTAFTVMATVSFVAAIGRMVNNPLQGSHEFVKLSLIIFFFSSLPLVVHSDTQIRVGLLNDLYKPWLAHIEKYFTAICEIAALTLISWLVYSYATRLEQFGTVTNYFQIPLAPWCYCAAALSILALWFGVQNLWKAFRNSDPPPDASQDDE